MKKLMLAAAAAALTGVTFAGNVFDYKASVKYVDYKKATIKVDKVSFGTGYLKQIKCASLSGYLVTPVKCPCTIPTAATTCRFGQAPAFLLVVNKAQKTVNAKYGTKSFVKILPANLLAEVWSNQDLTNKKKATLEAQGYLFAGLGKADAPAPLPEGSPIYGFGDKNATAATLTLFGWLNIADDQTFIEPWLDAAGFGKAQWVADGVIVQDNPCLDGDDPDKGSTCLISLAGSVIGGSYACVDHALGHWLDVYLCQGWDNETETSRAVIARMHEYADAYRYNVVSGTWSIKLNTSVEKLVAKDTKGKYGPSAAELAMYTAAYTGDNAYQFEMMSACGRVLDSKFDLTTFDTPVSTKAFSYANAFGAKWFK